MNVLITGGMGFVGRHFLKKYLSAGASVTVVDNLHPSGGGLDSDSPWFALNKINANDFNFIRKNCRDFFLQNNEKYDLVIHLANIVGGRMVIEQDPFEVALNLETDVQFFRWALKNSVSEVILFSSSAVYPTELQEKANSHFLSEIDLSTTNLRGFPDLMYGWEKLNLEVLARFFVQHSAAKVSIFRPFSGYGADQSLSYPIPNLCRQAHNIKSGQVFVIWGSGDQARDFVHIDDIIEAICFAKDKMQSGEVLNISSAVPTTFKQIAKYFLEFAGAKCEVQTKTNSPEGVYFRCGDNRKLLELGFKFQMDLKSGLRKVFDEYAMYSKIYPT